MMPGLSRSAPKRSAAVAEQLAFEHLGVDGAAVERDEGFCERSEY